MFAQPLFSTPMGSRSFYRDPFAARSRASYYDDQPFSLGRIPSVNGRPTVRSGVQPVFARPVYERYSESSEDEDDDSYGYYPSSRRDICTCGRCPRSIPSRTTGRLASRSSPVTQQKAKAKVSTARRSSPPTKKAASGRRSSEDSAAAVLVPMVSSDEVQLATTMQEEPPTQTPASPAAEETPEVASPVETMAETSAAGADDDVEDGAEAERLRSQVLASFSNVTAIMSEVEILRSDVEQFLDVRGSKEYLRLEDTLTRVLLRLDMVESHGDDKVRSVRRKAVVDAQDILGLLEGKTLVSASEHGEQQQPSHDNSASDAAADRMDVDQSGDAEEIAEDGALIDVESDSDIYDTSMLFAE